MAPDGGRDDRVQVDLEHVRALGAETPERHEHRHDGRPVDRRTAAHAAQEPGAAQVVEHRVGGRGVDRREPDRDVVEDLGQDAAEADEDGRPELRVAAQPEDELDARAPPSPRRAGRGPRGRGGGPISSRVSAAP